MLIKPIFLLKFLLQLLHYIIYITLFYNRVPLLLYNYEEIGPAILITKYKLLPITKAVHVTFLSKLYI